MTGVSYAYWLAIDCMHDRLIGMEVPWRVCASVGVCVEWTLLVRTECRRWYFCLRPSWTGGTASTSDI
jgi:hypothetical protein